MTSQFYRERAKKDTRTKAEILASEDGLKKRLEESFQGNEAAIERADKERDRALALEKDKAALKTEVARLTERVSYLEGYLQRIADEDQPDVVSREEHADTTPTPLRYREESNLDMIRGGLGRDRDRKEWYER
jgi:hypothetical protein